MDGQYPTFANTGTYGGKSPADAKYLDSPGARQMTVWYEFFSGTRHWELEPYFDVDGGRALALEGVEYIVYVEKSRPLELLVEKHGYDVAWINPATGERIKQKDFKGEHFTGQAPDATHDWVLQVSRESRKESMLRSYKFESREIAMQEVELNPTKVPFTRGTTCRGNARGGQSGGLPSQDHAPDPRHAGNDVVVDRRRGRRQPGLPGPGHRRPGPDASSLLVAANRRYIEFISAIDDPSAGTKKLEKISRTVVRNNRSYKRFNLFDDDDQLLFESIASGEFTISGFHPSI